jgi:hypothetical protein
MQASFFACLLLSLFAWAYALAEDDAELDRLRKAGDSRQLERYCRAELDKKPSVQRQAELVSELAGALAQQANTAREPDESQRLWDEADRVLDGFLKSHASNTRAPLLLRQRLVYAYTHGEALRRRAEIFPSEELLRQSRTRLQRALEHGRALEAAVHKQLDAYNAKNEQASFEQLVSLSNDTPFRLAHIRLSLAQTHPVPSAERAHLLQESTQAFEFYTREGFNDSELAVRAHLGLAECRRLQGRFEDAVRAVVPIHRSQAVQTLKDEALALHMNILLDQDQPQGAKALVKSRTKLSPDMALAQVRASLLEARQAAARGDRRGAAQLQSEALQRVEVGEREFSPAWALRAGVVLSRHADPDLPADGLDAAVRLAESFARGNRAPEAAAAFRDAARLARHAKRIDQELDFTGKAGAALARAGRSQEAAELLLDLLKQQPRHEKAPQLSILAAHALRRAWEADRKSETLEGLKTHVADHLRRHAGHETSGEAHFLAGYASSAERRWSAALDHFARVPAEHPLFADALAEQVRALRMLRPQLTVAESERLTQEILERLVRGENVLASRPELAARRSHIALARAEVLCRPGASPADFELARSLAEPLVKQTEENENQRKRARETLVLAFIGLGDRPEALAVIESTPQAESEAILRGLHEQLALWPAESDPKRQHALFAVRLAAARKLQSNRELSPAERQKLRRLEASALVVLGEHGAARALYDDLRKLKTDDSRLQEEHARALMHMGQTHDLQEAIEIWRQLSATRKEGTIDWLEAKYELAAALARTGEKERALKIVRLTQELWLNEATNDAARQEKARRFKQLEDELRQ